MWLVLACRTTGGPYPPPAVIAADCPTFAAPAVSGGLDAAVLSEASGLVASRRAPAVWWTHNDSGDTARLFAVGDDGKTMVTLDLGVAAVDWEDVAIGPGPDRTSWLYVADTGDNRAVRDAIVVYTLPEPDLADPAPAVAATAAWTYTYPEGKLNAETLLVDPRDGTLLIVTKSDDGTSHVYTDPHPTERPAGPKPLVRARTLTFGGAALPGSPKVTGGDVAPDGTGVILRTYESAFYWRIAAGQSIADALGEPPCPIPLATEEQGESIAFTPDGRGYVTVSEGNKPTLWRASRL